MLGQHEGDAISIRFVNPTRFLTTILILAAVAGCDKSTPSQPPSTQRIASVSPAGTDLLIGVGFGDAIVGVSNYDSDQDAAGKPRIGDYQTIDWEKLSPLNPNFLIVQFAGDRIPPDLQQRCDQHHIQLINIQLNNLTDVGHEMDLLCTALGDPFRGPRESSALMNRLAAVRNQYADQPRVKTLIVTSDNTFDIAGAGTFLDDLLTCAGGTNAAGPDSKPYFSIDKERLMAMSPDAILQLIPEGDKKPQVMAAAKQMWEALPDLPAVKNHRIYFITDWYCLQPGFRVDQLATTFGKDLHGRE